MIIYLVILEDRHNDAQHYPFLSKENALKCCNEIVKEYNYTREDYQVEDDKDVLESSDWLFYQSLSSENDTVYCQELEVEDVEDE